MASSTEGAHHVHHRLESRPGQTEKVEGASAAMAARGFNLMRALRGKTRHKSDVFTTSSAFVWLYSCGRAAARILPAHVFTRPPSKDSRFRIMVMVRDT